MKNDYKRRDFLKISGLATASVLNPNFGGYFLRAQSTDKLEVTREYPFIFGAQYYRAPTPEKACWEPDFDKMSQLGFTDVKLWVQWRWSHRKDDHFVFDDVDKLMELAHTHKLRVTLNTIFDVSPHWLFVKYPDAKQVMNNGQIVEPYVVGHRQIGGHPGPCYNHPGALEQRKKFMRVLVNHFKKFPALAMWDIWNEPEVSFPQRSPDMQRIVCYCPHCQTKFINWLKMRYSSLGQLNDVWGRCYEDWDQVEVPRLGDTFVDFIDWREFHIETMTNEARWRLEIVKELDPDRIHYLHVVPNTLRPFNPVSTCGDDFDLAKHCDVFAATMNNGPFFVPQVLSAGRNKICYNVESHINGGSTNMHQAIVDLPDLLNDFLPQIGMGIKGFLFWQFRAEILGHESPAWGLVNTDGSDREVTKATKILWDKLSPMKEKLMKCFPKPSEVGIWKSRKNEIFHFCLNKNFDTIISGVNAFSEAFYWNSYNYRYINNEMLEQGKLDDIRLLIMPSCYYLTNLETQMLNEWVHQGGVVLNESHLAAYNATTGRHSRNVPGGGLAEKWGLYEFDSVSSLRLRMNQKEILQMNVPEDTKKLLRDFGVSGAQYFPVRLNSGNILWGADRYTKIKSPGSDPLGWFHNDFPCIVQKNIGKGTVFYCGTNIGEGSRKESAGFMEFLNHAIQKAGIRPNLNITGNSSALRVDSLLKNDRLEFIVVRNANTDLERIMLDLDGKFEGLFSGTNLLPETFTEIPALFCDIFYRS